MKHLPDALAELAADLPTHKHLGPLASKAALARHVQQPHLRDGAILCIVNSLSNLLTWSRDELDAEHERLHGGAR